MGIVFNLIMFGCFTESKLCIGSEEAKVWPYCHVSLFLFYYLNSRLSNLSLRWNISFSNYHLCGVQCFYQDEAENAAVLATGVISDGADIKCTHFRRAGVELSSAVNRVSFVSDGLGSVRNSGFSPAGKAWHALPQMGSWSSPAHCQQCHQDNLPHHITVLLTPGANERKSASWAPVWNRPLLHAWTSSTLNFLWPLWALLSLSSRNSQSSTIEETEGDLSWFSLFWAPTAPGPHLSRPLISFF